VVLFQEFVNTSLNGRPSLFCIDSVHMMETSLSHALSINTKSMVFIRIRCFLGPYINKKRVSVGIFIRYAENDTSLTYAYFNGDVKFFTGSSSIEDKQFYSLSHMSCIDNF
jgi:hypothetical protein